MSMRRNSIASLAAAAAAGALFAFGLVLAGMTQPAKVLGFLNVGGLFDASRFGPWDPSLAFVMGGALAVSLVAFAWTPRAARRPWFAERFVLPSRRDIDARLVVGAVLFGAGWGLSGYCPGPALASLLTSGWDAAVFVGAMVAGMGLAQRWNVALPAAA